MSHIGKSRPHACCSHPCLHGFSFAIMLPFQKLSAYSGSATSSFCLDIFEAVPADFVRSAESCLLLLPVAAAVHLRSRLLILIGLSDLFLSSFLSRPRLLRLHHPCNRLPHHLSRLLPLLPLHPQPR